MRAHGGELMHRSTAVTFVVLGTIGAVLLARSIGGGSNIEQREHYWKEEIAKSINMETSTDKLELFAKNKGQTLHCYQNYKREEQCSFDDYQSLGGTSKTPMRLAVIFTIENGKVISHQFTTTSTDTPK